MKPSRGEMPMHTHTGGIGGYEPASSGGEGVRIKV